jgi:transcriptional regulator with XRE-family HTH domain
MPPRIGSGTPLTSRCYIKEWREHRNGMTQERLIARMEEFLGEGNVSKSSLSRIENGKQVYSQPILEAAAWAMNVDDVADLLRPPPSSIESELTHFIRKLDMARQQQALRVLKAAIGEEEAA